MTHSHIKSTLYVFLLAILSIGTSYGQIAEKIDFETQIKPIFERHCISCHGPDEAEGTRLDVRDDAFNYIEEGDSANSALYEYLISEDEEELMPPPDENNPLTAEQIGLVRVWIDQGADWPVSATLVDRSGESQTGLASEANDGDPMVDTSEDNPAAGSPFDRDPAEDKKKDESEVDTQVVLNAVGSLHPAMVHLPIGLLLAAGFFGLFALRGNFVMSDCAYYCLWLGTIGAIFACASGWWFSPMENRGDVASVADFFDDKQPIYWHRLTAIGATIFALLLSLFAAGARNRDPDDGVMWKLGCILLAVGIAYTGHEGGELTHGKDHYKDLNKLINMVFPTDQNAGAEKAMPDNEAFDADGTGSDREQKPINGKIDINRDGKSEVKAERA